MSFIFWCTLTLLTTNGVHYVMMAVRTYYPSYIISMPLSTRSSMSTSYTIKVLHLIDWKWNLTFHNRQAFVLEICYLFLSTSVQFLYTKSFTSKSLTFLTLQYDTVHCLFLSSSRCQFHSGRNDSGMIRLNLKIKNKK